MEQQPVNIKLNGENIELNPRNTAIVRYIAKYAIHNHVMIQTEDDVEYVFREYAGSDELNNILEDRIYPMALHCPEPTENVIQKHYELLQKLSVAQGEDIEEELEKWHRLFKNETETDGAV